MRKQFLVAVEDDVARKIQALQSDFQKEYGESITFSEVLNEMILKVCR